MDRQTGREAENKKWKQMQRDRNRCREIETDRQTVLVVNMAREGLSMHDDKS